MIHSWLTSFFTNVWSTPRELLYKHKHPTAVLKQMSVALIEQYTHCQPEIHTPLDRLEPAARYTMLICSIKCCTGYKKANYIIACCSAVFVESGICHMLTHMPQNVCLVSRYLSVGCTYAKCLLVLHVNSVGFMQSRTNRDVVSDNNVFGNF